MNNEHEIRAGQLLTTYGPGALIDLVEESVIVAGLDEWRYGDDKHIVREPRLEAKVRAKLGRKIELREPPFKQERFGSNPAFVPAFTFPTWFQVQNPERSSEHTWVRRRLVPKKALTKGKYENFSVVPIRFVQACPKGHISDIDWVYAVHLNSECKRNLWIEEDGAAAGNLSAIRVFCDCGKSVHLEILFKDSGRLGQCHGQRPWLGYGTNEECGEHKRAVIRSASNVYFPQLLSVISIPDYRSDLDQTLDKHWGDLGALPDKSVLAALLSVPRYKADFDGFDVEQVWQAIQGRQDGTDDPDDANVKDTEFLALSHAKPGSTYDPINDSEFFACQIPLGSYRGWNLSNFFEKLVAVHKLREVTTILGFTRLEPITRDVDGEFDAGTNLEVAMAALSVDADWLPAMENRGEGLFLQLNSARVAQWEARVKDSQYGKNLEAAFKKWQTSRKSSIPYPEPRYYLAHSLAHLVLQALTLECGYPSSSLKERIYVGPDHCALLIYTASSDVEGTLGGLVQAGKNLGRLLVGALEEARLCTNDPVCASHTPLDPDERMRTGASCHGCLHVPETSCEQWNEFLDRSLVVETLEQRGVAYFE